MSSKTDALNGLLQARASAPDVFAFADSLMDECDGATGLAHEVWQEIRDTKKGTPGRARLLCAMVDLMKFIALKGKNRDPLDGMNLEQLQSAVRDLTGNDASTRQVSNSRSDTFAHPRD